jgi:hypothetical protein
MIALPNSRSKLRHDLVLTAAMAVVVTGLCLALVWLAPFELVPVGVR